MANPGTRTVRKTRTVIWRMPGVFTELWNNYPADDAALAADRNGSSDASEMALNCVVVRLCDCAIVQLCGCAAAQKNGQRKYKGSV